DAAQPPVINNAAAARSNERAGASASNEAPYRTSTVANSGRRGMRPGTSDSAATAIVPPNWVAAFRVPKPSGPASSTFLAKTGTAVRNEKPKTSQAMLATSSVLTTGLADTIPSASLSA